jgi:hypothetical protein
MAEATTSLGVAERTTSPCPANGPRSATPTSRRMVSSPIDRDVATGLSLLGPHRVPDKPTDSGTTQGVRVNAVSRGPTGSGIIEKVYSAAAAAVVKGALEGHC